MSESTVPIKEGGLLCQTIRATFVSEQDLELQIRIHVEESTITPDLVSLLKMGVITWRLPSCKVHQATGVCEQCCKTFATTHGEIGMLLNVTGNNKCQDCLIQTQDMQKNFAEKEPSFEEESQDQCVKQDMHLSSEEGGINEEKYMNEKDTDCDENLNVDNDGDGDIENSVSEEGLDPVEDIRKHGIKKLTAVLDSLYKEFQITKRRRKYVRFECRICAKKVSSKTAILKHISVQHSDVELSNSTNVEDSSVEVDIGNGNVGVETTDSSAQRTGSLIGGKRTRTVSSVRPYKCQVCSRTYQMLKTLKSHERTHRTGTLNCNICGQEFHLQSRLEYHLRLHTGERPFQCTICGNSFMKNSHLTHHLKTHSDERAYTCPDCGRGFTEACYLRVHQRNHSGERPFQCHVCGKCFTNSSSFRVHQLVHDDKKYKCDTCQKIFQTLKTLQDHQVIHSGVRPFVCDVCGTGCVTPSRLNRHRKIHTAERPFVCNVCGKGFCEKYDLKAHSKTHSEDRTFKCDVCSKSFAKKTSLRNHSSTHSSEHPYRCPECGKEFTALRLLKKHSEIHSCDKRFMCELCGKSFHLSNSLKSHTQTHKGYRPHTCDICGRKYRSVWYMQIHRKTHTGENLIECKDCGDWFVNPSYFKRHQEKHCKGKLIHCTICNHGFSFNWELQKHMGLHTGDRPFGCHICGSAFARNALLQDHIKRHTQDYVHKCSTCGKGFKRVNDLRKHEKRHARKMKKVLLQDEMKHGHKDNFAALQEKDILQQATESIRDAKESNVLEEDVGTCGAANKHLVPLSTIDHSQFQQTRGVSFAQSDKNNGADTVLVTTDHSCISDVPVHGIQTSEGIPVQSFTSTDRIIIQVDHPYISSQTTASAGVHLQALTSEPCGMFAPAGVSVMPTIQMLPSVSEDTLLEQGHLQTLQPLQTNTGQLPHTDQHLNEPAPQTTSLTNDMSTHGWIYH